MTNREWLAQNPEQITGDLADEIMHGFWKQTEFPFAAYIDNYLNEAHEQRECTVITTYEVTEIIMRDLDEADEGLVAEERAEKIKALLDADDVKVAKIQIFKRGFDA